MEIQIRSTTHIRWKIFPPWVPDPSIFSPPSVYIFFAHASSFSQKICFLDYLFDLSIWWGCFYIYGPEWSSWCLRVEMVSFANILQPSSLHAKFSSLEMCSVLHSFFIILLLNISLNLYVNMLSININAAFFRTGEK